MGMTKNREIGRPDEAGGVGESIERKPKKAGIWRPVTLIVAIIAVIVTANYLGLGERLGDLQNWIRSLGAWGPAVFAVLYIIGVVAALPGSALTLAAGALFGSVLGLAVVSLASTVGATLAFLVSRYFARQAVVNWLSDNEKFQKLDRMTERHGPVIVALTRLVPLFPFNLLNYGFGLTKVPLKVYVFWSWLVHAAGDGVVRGRLGRYLQSHPKRRGAVDTDRSACGNGCCLILPGELCS